MFWLCPILERRNLVPIRKSALYSILAVSIITPTSQHLVEHSLHDVYHWHIFIFCVAFHDHPFKTSHEDCSVLMNARLPPNDGKQYAFSWNCKKPLWSVADYSCDGKLDGYLRHLYQQANEDWPVRSVPGIKLHPQTICSRMKLSGRKLNGREGQNSKHLWVTFTLLNLLSCIALTAACQPLLPNTLQRLVWSGPRERLGVRHVVRPSLNCSFKRTCYKKGWRQIYYHFLWRMSGHESPSIMMPCQLALRGRRKKINHTCGILKSFDFDKKGPCGELNCEYVVLFCASREEHLCALSPRRTETPTLSEEIFHVKCQLISSITSLYRDILIVFQKERRW